MYPLLETIFFIAEMKTTNERMEIISRQGVNRVLICLLLRNLWRFFLSEEQRAREENSRSIIYEPNRKTLSYPVYVTHTFPVSASVFHIHSILGISHLNRLNQGGWFQIQIKARQFFLFPVFFDDKINLSLSVVCDCL